MNNSEGGLWFKYRLFSRFKPTQDKDTLQLNFDILFALSKRSSIIRPYKVFTV